jgi:hypothetical protein
MISLHARTMKTYGSIPAIRETENLKKKGKTSPFVRF